MSGWVFKTTRLLDNPVAVEMLKLQLLTRRWPRVTYRRLRRGAPRELRYHFVINLHDLRRLT